MESQSLILPTKKRLDPPLHTLLPPPLHPRTETLPRLHLHTDVRDVELQFLPRLPLPHYYPVSSQRQEDLSPERVFPLPLHFPLPAPPHQNILPRRNDNTLLRLLLLYDLGHNILHDVNLPPLRSLLLITLRHLHMSLDIRNQYGQIQRVDLRTILDFRDS